MSLRNRLRADQPEPDPAAERTAEAPLVAARAAGSKKAIDIRILDLRGVSSFTDFFIVCSGANSRQIQTIADEVGQQLKHHGQTPLGVEGYDKAEWVLADYGDFIVHIFSQAARRFYDLERLWRTAKEIPLSEPDSGGT